MTSIYLNAAQAMREDMSPLKEISHSLATCHVGGRPDRRPNSTVGYLADFPGCPSLVSAAVVAASGVLHTQARIGRLVQESHGLAGLLVAVLGRLSVPHVDVAVGRRFGGAVAVVAEGAVLQGVAGVASGWRVVVGVGHGSGLRVALREVSS